MKFEFLSKHFPLPKFLNPSHIGISFSDSSIKAIFFDKSIPKPELKNIVIPLQKGVIVGGKIVNQKEVVRKLSAIKETFGLSFVFFTIPDELTYVYQATIPIGQGGNAVESVAFTIEENVPLLLIDTVFDFIANKIVKSESGYQAEVVVAACVRNEVEKFAIAIRESGLEPLGCIHESQAIANSVIQKGFLGMPSIVHTRKDRIGIYLVKDGIVYFSTLRSVVEEDYRSQFLDEYRKFLEYSERYKTDQKSPTETVFVCGEFEYAKKIVDTLALHPEFGSNIKLSNVWGNIFKIEDNVPSINYEDSLNLAGPVGAVLAEII